MISGFSFDLDWHQVIYHFGQLAIAFVFSLPIALNREYQSKGAGLRTFPLVSIATCAYMLVGMQVFENQDAVARVMYGIITGMGFIGGGAILKTDNNVVGTATAASIWNTGGIGIAVAFGRYEIALLLSLINFVILQFAQPLKQDDSDEANDKQRADDDDQGD